MVTKTMVETAYCFFHQKQRVFQYSTMEWQKEDIEYAINSYLDGMSPALYELISEGQSDFLRHHESFGDHLMVAVERLEVLLNSLS